MRVSSNMKRDQPANHYMSPRKAMLIAVGLILAALILWWIWPRRSFPNQWVPPLDESAFHIGCAMAIPVCLFFAAHASVRLALRLRDRWLRIEEYPGMRPDSPPIGNQVAGVISASTVLPFLAFSLAIFPWLSRVLGDWREPMSATAIKVAALCLVTSTYLTAGYLVRVNLED